MVQAAEDFASSRAAGACPPAPGSARRTALFIALVAGLLVVTRVPLLLGPASAIDGDEAILGLMAKHATEGHFSLFLYGQSYGLALPEAGLAALFFLVFGVSSIALHAAVLTLWATGATLLALAAGRIGGRGAAAATAVLAASCPAWLLLSMKAWGGYVTGWACASLVVYLVAVAATTRRPGVPIHVAIGAGLGLAGASHPLWLVVLPPFVVALLATRARVRHVAAVLVGGAVVGGAFAATAMARGGYWTPGVFDDPDVARALVALPARIWVSLGGLYWYEKPGRGGIVWAFTTAAWMAFFVVALGSLPGGLRRRKWLRLRQAGLYGMVASCLFTFLIDARFFGYRYLLPASLPFILWLGVSMGDGLARVRRRQVVVGLLVVTALAGVGTAATVASLAPSAMLHDGRVHSRAEVRALVAELEARGIRDVYSVDPMLHWNIMFTSREAIRARWVHPSDRVPAYPRAVDRALFAGRPVAVVGWEEDAGPLRAALDRAGLRAVPVEPVANRFFLLPTSDPVLVRRLGFFLNEPDATAP